MIALSVRQPWAWLLLNGKDVENRDWYTNYRGPLAIHASKSMTKAEYFEAVDMVRRFDPDILLRMPGREELVKGAIIGTVNMIGCVTESSSPWFFGPYGFVVETPVEIEPVYVNGKLGLWNWEPGGAR